MKLVIDLQCLQNDNRFRGIGRYAAGLTEAIIEIAPAKGVEIHIAVSKSPASQVSAIQRRFSHMHGAGRIHVFDGMNHLQDSTGRLQSEWVRTVSGRLRMQFLSELRADAVLECSPFDGWATGLSAGEDIGRPYKSFGVLYDLIPLLNPSTYLSDRVYKRFYKERLSNLRRADGLIAISESAKAEGIHHLGYDPDRLTVAYGDADSAFSPGVLSSSDSRRITELLGKSCRFLLYCGALETRKNLNTLVGAMCLVPESVRSDLHFVVAGNVSPSEEFQLRKRWTDSDLPKENLHILGYTSEEDLVRLYRGAATFVFPSKHEGFGLPVLEAIRCRTPVVVSNATSLPEIAVAEASKFDPNSPQQLADRLMTILYNDDVRELSIRENLDHCGKFNWKHSAESALSLIDRFTIRSSRPIRARRIEDQIDCVLTGPMARPGPTEDELANLAVAITWNARSLDRAERVRKVPSQPVWRLEGPFDSSYSLAIVNRHLALALSRIGIDVKLFSSEGNGDFDPSEGFLKNHPEVAGIFDGQLRVRSDIVSRNMFPPRVHDLDGDLRLLHSYGWEETGFPGKWVRNINLFVDGITTMSAHVTKILIDAGVEVDIENVGIGVDHLQVPFSAPSSLATASKFELLHVSSCFPRKGVDVLLEAYGRAFKRTDSVRLTIKTFPNLHNNVQEQIEDLKRRFRDLPPVTLINEDVSDEDLSRLYVRSSVVVLPSRAEGFCLPAAEAILCGRPVIMTGWGGQMEFASLPSVRLIDFEFVRAESHLMKFDSVWAEPSTDHLAELLMEAYRKQGLDDETAKRARAALLERFSWNAVATRSLEAATRIAARTPVSPPKIAFISTYNTMCGIAEFTANMVAAIDDEVMVFAPHDNPLLDADPMGVVRCWYQGQGETLSELYERLVSSNVDVVVLQFNYGFYDFNSLSWLLERLNSLGRVTVVHFHSTQDPADKPEKRLSSLASALGKCTALIVHSPADMNRLKMLGLVDNVSLFPLGMLDFPVTPHAKHPSQQFVVSSYGFFLPQKGLDNLIEATAILIKRGYKVKLEMLNAEYPSPISAQAIFDSRSKIQDLHLEGSVSMDTSFMSNEETIARLRACDAVVFPYRPTLESASAAVRHAIAACVPTFVTPLPIFDEFGEAVFRFSGHSAQDLANGLAMYIDHQVGRARKPLFDRMNTAAQEWRSTHRYSVVAKRYLAALRQWHRRAAEKQISPD